MRRLIVIAFVVLACTPAAGASPKEIEATDCMWSPDAQYDGLHDGFAGIDRSAFYALMFPSANMPGAHWRFRGEFPNARYFGFQTYTDMTTPIDTLRDSDMVPDAGSVAPFRGRPWRRGHVSYTIDLRDVPLAGRAHRAANVLYGGYFDDGHRTNRDQIEYRIYVPDRSIKGRGIKPGGVPLPRVFYVIDDPKTAQWHTHDDVCRFNGGGTTFRGIHEADNRFIVLDPVLRQLGGRYTAATNPPAWWSSSQRYNRWFPYGNQDADYLFSFANPDHGEVLVLRFKAPTYSPELGPPTDSRQVRYWSICGVQTLNFFYSDACLRDSQLHPDARGYVTVAMSEPANRPRVDGRAYADWLPLPGGYDMIWMRQIRPNPRTFKESPFWIQSTVDDAAVRAHMGEYYPSGVYCSRAAFERTRCR